ncbi:putative phospholipid-transporting ATPase 8 [Hibiscus syriacus]|uniref:Phospholipid-transporting ATPase 8 n=1 Tax=Hibiscus syriacus TaxID=106335 RepID=A0A6A3BY46_HIBSY|nr:putative phospholipid-transporting ATPase 8 [Hibiscus syriacus]
MPMNSRKRMSVIVQNEEGKLLLLCKGADSAMFERLEFAEQTKEHIEEYADAGLRTLVLAYREIGEEEYVKFNEEFTEAKNVVSADREEMIKEVAEKIERELILLGATAVEEKLQNGVPECIDKLAQAGIKIWVLTGDKMETAINIGFPCSLLRQGMKQVVINSETPENKALEKSGDKTTAAAAYKVSVIQQIAERKQLLASSNENTEALALIVDGKSLTYDLEDDVKDSFICYFFYKNIASGFTIFFFEIYASFSGQAVYNDWFLSLYNVFFTSLPVIALGVFDQDVSSRLCLMFPPLLYQEGIQNVLFSWLRIVAWASNGVLSATIIFFFGIREMQHQAFRKGGEVAGLEVLGVTMYTCVVWVVNCQMASSITYFTYIQHLFIWGGIILWVVLASYTPSAGNLTSPIFRLLGHPNPIFPHVPSDDTVDLIRWAIGRPRVLSHGATEIVTPHYSRLYRTV